MADWTLGRRTGKSERRLPAIHGAGLALAAGPLALALLPQAGLTWLAFDRIAISQGEWWRLVTGNFVHVNLAHGLLNLAGLFLVLALFRHQLTTRLLLIATLPIALATGALTYWLDPGLDRYAGLSGILHGLFVLGALRCWPTAPRLASLLILFLTLKLVQEQTFPPLSGRLPFLADNIAVTTHLFGAVAGGCLGTLILQDRFRRVRYAG